MTNTNTLTSPTLVDQQSALLVYLQDLLLEPCLTPAPVTDAAPAAAAPISAQATQAVTKAWCLDDAAQFQCLVFETGGFTLAVPLTQLNGVLPYSAVTPMPGHAAWFLGLKPHLGAHIKVVDTAALLTQHQHGPPAPPRDAEKMRYIVLIDDAKWGLACDKVSEVITLDAGALRRRAQHTTQPWLIGTVTERLCTLLDAQAFAQALLAGAPHT